MASRRAILALLLAGLALGAWAVGTDWPPAQPVQQALTALHAGQTAQAEALATDLANSDRPGAWRGWLIAAAARQKLGAYEQAEEAYLQYLPFCASPHEREYVAEQIQHCRRAAGPCRKHTPVGQAMTPEQRAQYSVVEGEEAVETTDHFVVRSSNAALAKLVAQHAELALARVCSFVFTSRDYPHSVAIHIWPDAEEYRKHATSAREWEGGSFTIQSDEGAQTVRRIDLTQLNKDRLFDPDVIDRVLPHEMCHLVMTEFFGDTRAPLALSEGMAMLAEAGVDNGRVSLAGESLGGRQKIALGDLLREARPKKADVFYAESFSFMHYVHESLTPRQFRETLEHVRIGLPLDEALQRALYLPPDDDFLDHLAKAWESEAIRQAHFLHALDEPASTS